MDGAWGHGKSCKLLHHRAPEAKAFEAVCDVPNGHEIIYLVLIWC